MEGVHTFFFRHYKDPGFDKCPIKTNSNFSKVEIQKRQYAFKKESKPHILLKEKVGSIIKRYIDNEVIVDSKFIKDRFGDSERRKPDIFFNHQGKEMTIEFQINNTFHSIIEEREAFYERNKISLMWVFGSFEIDQFLSITQKDIYVPNHNNAFVFDNEAEIESEKGSTLCLHVYYKTYFIKRDRINFKWQNKIISLDQLSFNNSTSRPYYYDSPLHKRETEIELEKRHEKEAIKEAKKKANSIKSFLNTLKRNDQLPFSEKLTITQSLTKVERDELNKLLNLSNYHKNGKNIIEILFKANNHSNLILFLLKALNIELNITSNKENNTLLVSFLNSNDPNKFDYIKLLFLRGYHLSKIDVEFIGNNYEKSESERLIQKFNYFEKVNTLDQIEIIEGKLNELFVIESSKQGQVKFLGNKKQGLIWLVNLAANAYSDTWYYIDRAFKFYKFYDLIFKADKKGTFRNNLNRLKTHTFNRDYKFESVFKLIYPEIDIENTVPKIGSKTNGRIVEERNELQ